MPQACLSPWMWFNHAMLRDSGQVRAGFTLIKMSRVQRPVDAMMYIDTLTHYVYSPVDPSYPLTLDMDGDGAVDTMGAYPDTPFNFARPTVHNNGANVTLMDGHVERVAYKALWKVNTARKVVHSYSYLDD